MLVSSPSHLWTSLQAELLLAGKRELANSARVVGKFERLGVFMPCIAERFSSGGGQVLRMPDRHLISMQSLNNEQAKIFLFDCGAYIHVFSVRIHEEDQLSE
jgi:hypothetical protein